MNWYLHYLPLPALLTISLRLLRFYCTSYLNFADPDKVSILLNDVSSFQWVAVFEPGEGGRWDPGCGAFQLQWTVDSNEELLWRAGAGHLWRLWRRDHQNIWALQFIYLKKFRLLCDYQAR